MRCAVLVIVMLAWTGCASVTQVRDSPIEASQTPVALVSGAAGNEVTGQRILIGASIGAAIGAVAGAALVEYGSDEYDFVGDNSGTEPWKGALVGGVVGAAVGAVLAVITAKKATPRRLPPLPDHVTKGVLRPLHGTRIREATPRCLRSFSCVSFYGLQVDPVEAKRMVAVR